RARQAPAQSADECLPRKLPLNRSEATGCREPAYEPCSNDSSSRFGVGRDVAGTSPRQFRGWQLLRSCAIDIVDCSRSGVGREGMSSSHFVIASEAKQSTLSPRKQSGFASSLARLAMTSLRVPAA